MKKEKKPPRRLKQGLVGQMLLDGVANPNCQDSLLSGFTVYLKPREFTIYLLHRQFAVYLLHRQFAVSLLHKHSDGTNMFKLCDIMTKMCGGERVPRAARPVLVKSLLLFFFIALKPRVE